MSLSGFRHHSLLLLIMGLLLAAAVLLPLKSTPIFANHGPCHDAFCNSLGQPCQVCGFTSIPSCDPVCDATHACTVNTGPNPDEAFCQSGGGGSCLDTDGGINPEVLGVCQGTNGSFFDGCSGSLVLEYTCSSDGSCVSEPPRSCAPRTCFGGQCLAGTGCSDSDGDLAPTTTFFDQLNTSTPGTCTDASGGTATDACFGGQLFEFFCSTNTNQCEVRSGCSGGCISTPTGARCAGSAPTCSISPSFSTIVSGESKTLSWTATNATSCSSSSPNWTASGTPNGSSTVSPTSNQTYSLTCTGPDGTGSCSATVNVTPAGCSYNPGDGDCCTTSTPAENASNSPECAAPPPEPPPPLPPPVLVPCQKPEFTDNLTKVSVDPIEYRYSNFFPASDPGYRTSVRITNTFTHNVDLSQLSAMFAASSSNYLESNFQDQTHREKNLLGLNSQDFNAYHGPADKTAPKVMTDRLRQQYVAYMDKEPTILEAANTYSDIWGNNPQTVTQLLASYGVPNPPSLGGDQSAWQTTWGRYWGKIPTAVNENYYGFWDYTLAEGDAERDLFLNAGFCPKSVGGKIKFFVMPEYFRTASIANQINQLMVPKAAQSSEADFVEKEFFASQKEYLGNLLKAVTDSALLEAIKKIFKISALVNPQTVYAEFPFDAEEPVDYCPAPIPVLPNDREGTGPFCALPIMPNLRDPDQIDQSIGEECTDRIHCTFKHNYVNEGDFQVPYDSRWDGGQCTEVYTEKFEDVDVDGNGVLDSLGVSFDGFQCSTTIRLYPIFYFPWLAPIWNNTTYSDTADSHAILGFGKTGKAGQQTGRPGGLGFFIPQALRSIVHPWGPNLPSEDAGAGPEVRQRLSGAVDCQKKFVRDNSLKPLAMQKDQGITDNCDPTTTTAKPPLPPGPPLPPPGPAPGSPPAPSGLNVVTDCSGGQPFAYFTWNNMSVETSFYLDVNEAPWTGPGSPSPWGTKTVTGGENGFFWGTAGGLSFPLGSGSPTIISNNTTYYWRVSSFNSFGQSAHTYPPNSASPPGGSFTTPNCSLPGPQPISCTGPRSPATVTAWAPGGGAGWLLQTVSPPTYNALSQSDDRKAITNSSGIEPNSQWLLLTNLGFSIPSTATISGVEVAIEGQRISFGDSYPRTQLLFDAGGAGDIKDGSIFAYRPAADETQKIGSSTDLWGNSFWLTPANVNASNFGVGLKAIMTGSADAQIDHVTVDVCYTP